MRFLFAVFFTISISCAHQSPKAKVSEKIESSTDFYFSSYDFRPVVVSKSSGVCSATLNLKDRDWKSQLDSINACALLNQWGLVETIANELIKTNIHSPWGPYFLSLSAESTKDLPRALWMIDLAIKKATSKTAVLEYQRGRILWLLNQKDQAVSEFSLAAKLDKNIYDANLLLAEVAYHELDYKNASEKFKAVIDVDKKNYAALVDGAECMVSNGESKLAVEYLERAIAVRPENLSIRERLAQIYEELQKEPELALTTYKALKAAIARGTVQDRPTVNLNEKIKVLEASLARVSKKVQPSATDAKIKRGAASQL